MEIKSSQAASVAKEYSSVQKAHELKETDLQTRLVSSFFVNLFMECFFISFSCLLQQMESSEAELEDRRNFFMNRDVNSALNVMFLFFFDLIYGEDPPLSELAVIVSCFVFAFVSGKWPQEYKKGRGEAQKEKKRHSKLAYTATSLSLSRHGN